MRVQGNGGGQTQAKRLESTMSEVEGVGQDFEQSQANHGWPSGARFGHSLWIFGKIQYQV